MDHLLMLCICSLLCTGVSGILYPNLFMASLGTITVEDNSSLTVSCFYSSDEPCDNVSLVWLIDDHHGRRAINIRSLRESCESDILSPLSGGGWYLSKPDENGFRNYFFSWTNLALTRADHGQRWQCEVQVHKNSFRVQYHRTKATFISVEGVAGPDRLLMYPQPTTTVTENDILTLTCLYTTNLASTEFTLEWRKDGAPVAATVGCHNTTDIIPLGYIGHFCKEFGSETYTYKLTTAPTRADDGQKWECVARTTHNDQYQHSGVTTVSVNVPITNVTITSPPENTVRIEEGTETEFVCETSPSRPGAFAIAWFLYTGPKIDSMINWFPWSVNSNWKIKAGDPASTRTVSDRLIVTTKKLKLKPSRKVNGWKIFCGASNIKDEFSWLSSEIQTSDEKVLDVYQRLN